MLVARRVDFSFIFLASDLPNTYLADPEFIGSPLPFSGQLW